MNLASDWTIKKVKSSSEEAQQIYSHVIIHVKILLLQRFNKGW